MFKTHEEQGCTICVFLNLIRTKSLLCTMPKSLVLVCMVVTIEKIKHNGQGVMLSLRTDQ